MNRSWPTTLWQTLAPATVGMDADKLSGLDTWIKSDYPDIHGIVVVRHGAIVYEKYDHGYGGGSAPCCIGYEKYHIRSHWHCYRCGLYTTCRSEGA